MCNPVNNTILWISMEIFKETCSDYISLQSETKRQIILSINTIDHWRVSVQGSYDLHVP